MPKKTRISAAPVRSIVDRDPFPVVVNGPKSGLPFDGGWRQAKAAQNILAFGLARPFRARLIGADGRVLPVRIAACVTSGARSFDIVGDGKRPRYAVLIEPKRRDMETPPEGRYDLVSDCAWIGKISGVPLRHVPAGLRDRLRARTYFHVV